MENFKGKIVGSIYYKNVQPWDDNAKKFSSLGYCFIVAVCAPWHTEIKDMAKGKSKGKVESKPA